MTLDEGNTTTQIKQMQWRIVCVIMAIVFTIVIGIYSLSHDNKSASAHQSKAEPIYFDSPLNHVNESSAWEDRIESELVKEKQHVNELEHQIEQLNQEKTVQDNEKQSQAFESQALQNSLSESKNQEAHKIPIESMSTDKVPMPGANDYSGGVLPPPPVDVQNSETNDAFASVQSAGINEGTISLAPQKTGIEKPIKNPDTFVPSGTFVKAIMLGGADASASVTSQANPMPMLFRIIDEGTLPNHQRSHLKDCIVTAAVMGDISSERGEIRLERMSCTHPDSEVVDMSVEGTVFDPSGKNGIRGNPVWREGTLLQRAFVAGALSGIADGLSQRYVTSSVSPLGSTQNVSGSSIFQYGTAHGASTALDKLADYTIQRAEQYHPVIQLSAGTTVDLVFLKGFYLDGKEHDEAASHDIAALSVNTAPPKTIDTSDEQQTPMLPLTDNQINKLKLHQRELGISTEQAQ